MIQGLANGSIIHLIAVLETEGLNHMEDSESAVDQSSPNNPSLRSGVRSTTFTVPRLEEAVENEIIANLLRNISRLRLSS